MDDLGVPLFMENYPNGPDHMFTIGFGDPCQNHPQFRCIAIIEPDISTGDYHPKLPGVLMLGTETHVHGLQSNHSHLKTTGW